MERGADGANTGYAFPTCWWTSCGCRTKAGATRRTTSSTPICPLIRYEQQPGVGLAVRKYVMMRRGIIASDALRKPGGGLPPPPAPRSTICSRASRARIARGARLGLRAAALRQNRHREEP